MRNARIVALGALVVLLVMMTGITVAWAVDESRHKNEVGRNVQLAGTDVGGLSRDDLSREVALLADRYRNTSLKVGEERTFDVPAAQARLELAQEPTIDGALKVGRDGNILGRIAGWIGALSGEREAPIEVTFDPGEVSKAVVANDPGPRTEPAEPTLEVREDRLAVVPGKDGEAIDPQAVIAGVDAAAQRGTPLRIAVAPVRTPPRFADTDAERLARQAESGVVAPLPVTVDGNRQSVDSSLIRPWIKTKTTDRGLALDIDDRRMRRDLEIRYERAGQEVQEPTWSVEDGRPFATPGRSGTACCEAAGFERVQKALGDRIQGIPTADVLDLPLKVTEPSVTADEIPGLRIVEPVATFTTNHASSGPRVTNIHRIADLTRGSVIEPGQTFSLNDAVGRRTVERGFVVDKVIDEGKYAEAVGGGISQYATTLFNAAFFAGLDYGQYQSHSIYINRYPYGREATVSFPSPDLQIRNSSPNGILIWPTYTDSSITVTLYSTLYAQGAQTGQSEAQSGKCTKVTTERTRRYVDGRTNRDSVIALYQPEEGVRC